MQYSVAEFNQSLDDEAWYGFVQALADSGFEAFDGPKAYIQTALFHPEALKRLVAATEGIELVSIADCPDENWNAAWEENHPMYAWNINDRQSYPSAPLEPVITRLPA